MRRSANERAHLKCSSCAYDLFSLATDGACPECGYPIFKTIQDVKHKDAERNRLSGAAGLIWAYIAMLITMNVFVIFTQDIAFACFLLLLLIVGGAFAAFVVFMGLVTRMWHVPEFAAAVVLCGASCLMFAGNAMWLEVGSP